VSRNKPIDNRRYSVANGIHVTSVDPDRVVLPYHQTDKRQMQVLRRQPLTTVRQNGQEFGHRRIFMVRVGAYATEYMTDQP
jgi:hypothetical protein